MNRLRIGIAVGLVIAIIIAVTAVIPPTAPMWAKDAVLLALIGTLMAVTAVVASVISRTAGRTSSPCWRCTALFDQDTIEAIAAGILDDGVDVTVTGIANCRVMKISKQGSPWAEYELIGERSSIKMQVLPWQYATYADVLNNATDADGELRPATVTVTGKVNAKGIRPALVAVEITPAAKAVAA